MIRRTIARADALALRSAIDAHHGYPHRHTADELSGATSAEVWTITAVAIDGDGATVDVSLDESDLAFVADAALRDRVQSAPRPERDRLPATGLSPVSSTARMLPVVLLANELMLPSAIEKAPGEVHVLWDVALDLGDLGTRYVREDGTREFVVQPVVALAPQLVAILWSAGSDDDPGEALYVEQMLAAAVAGGLIEAHWSCTRSGVLWLPDSLRADVLAAWPAEWRSGGSPCVGPPV